MNNNPTKTNRGTKKPFPLFTYFCLLLAVATMCTGVTFARYVTSSHGGAAVGVVPLACSFSVDEISSTAFNNSDYWLTIESQLQAQNPPREIIFSLHNYQTNADGTKSAPSEIDLQSTFRFFAPKEFLENVAFQILKKGDGNTRIPLTQQYVLPQIIQRVENGEGSVNTSEFVDANDSSKPANYGEYSGRPEETLTLTNYDFSTAGNGKFVAIAQTEENVQVATIALTAEMRENVKYDITQTRGNQFKVDAGDGTMKTVNDMSAPEYYGTYQVNQMVYYCLDITLPSMIMQAKQNSDGTFQSVDDQYVFAFTIIGKQDFNTNTDKKVEEHFNVKGVSLYNDPDCGTEHFSKAATVKVVNTLGTDGSTIASTKYFLVEGTTETELELNNNTVTLKDGSKYYVDAVTDANLNNPRWNPFAEKAEDTLSYETADAVRKVYSIDMRVLFTQASQTGGN